MTVPSGIGIVSDLDSSWRISPVHHPRSGHVNRAGAIDAAFLCRAGLLERLNLPAPNRPVGGLAENMIWAGDQHCDA